MESEEVEDSGEGRWSGGLWLWEGFDWKESSLKGSKWSGMVLSSIDESYGLLGGSGRAVRTADFGSVPLGTAEEGVLDGTTAFVVLVFSGLSFSGRDTGEAKRALIASRVRLAVVSFQSAFISSHRE